MIIDIALRYQNWSISSNKQITKSPQQYWDRYTVNEVKPPNPTREHKQPRQIQPSLEISEDEVRTPHSGAVGIDSAKWKIWRRTNWNQVWFPLLEVQEAPAAYSFFIRLCCSTDVSGIIRNLLSTGFGTYHRRCGWRVTNAR